MWDYSSRELAEQIWIETWEAMTDEERAEHQRREEEDYRRGLELVDQWPAFSDLCWPVEGEGKAA
jgi:hypothetical protein